MGLAHPTQQHKAFDEGEMRPGELFVSFHPSEGRMQIYWSPVYKASSQLWSTGGDPFSLSENPFGRYLCARLRSFSCKWSLGGRGVEDGR